MPTVRIPKPFRKHTGGEVNVHIVGSTVGAAFADLFQRHPDLRQQIYDDAGKLITTTHESINVLLDKHDIRELQGAETPLKETDQLLILRSWPAAISGGAWHPYRRQSGRRQRPGA
ncbi:MAG: MoaD/ThiS family protein [Anaerolineae bacterium]